MLQLGYEILNFSQVYVWPFLREHWKAVQSDIFMKVFKAKQRKKNVGFGR